MNDADLVRVVDKQQKLKALHRARARVQQLERELRGEPATAEEPTVIPDFLRKPVAGGRPTTTALPRRGQGVSSEGPLTLESARKTGRRA